MRGGLKRFDQMTAFRRDARSRGTRIVRIRRTSVSQIRRSVNERREEIEEMRTAGIYRHLKR